MEEDALEKRKSKIKNFLFGWIKDNYDKTFLAVLIVAFIIRFWIFLGTIDQPLWYDAASYLATAKQWGLGLEIEDIWYYRRGFLWPLIGAVFFKLGLGETGIRFSEVLFSTGIVAVSYFLIKEMFNKKLALFTSIGLTFSWLLLFFTARPLTSIPATFFILTALLFFWKGYIKNQGNKFTYISGIFFALTILTRTQFVSFIPVFLVAAFLKEKFKMFKNKSLWVTLIIFFLVLTPHLIMYSQHYGNPVTDIMSFYIGIEGVSKTGQTNVRYFSDSFRYFTDLPYILASSTPSMHPNQILIAKMFFILFLIGVVYFLADLILGFDKIFKNKNLQKKLIVTVWIAVLFLSMGYVSLYIEQRYVISGLTFLFLIVAIPFIKLEEYLVKKNVNKKIATALIFLVFLIFLIPNLVWANNLIEAKKTSYLEVKQAGLWLKDNSNLEDIVMTASAPQIQYYSERSTYTQGRNESDFKERIKELKPRYLILSVFESHPQWMLQYPQEHNGTLIPVKVYQQNEQPLLIIYEFVNESKIN